MRGIDKNTSLCYIMDMKRYIVGFTFRYTESNEDYYCIYEENEYEEYKKFFCETCVGKDLVDIWFSPLGE